MEEAQELKEKAIEIFKDATFTLHKWQSKEPRLEESPVSLEKDFCKATRRIKAGGSSLLGLGWNKECDEVIVSFPD